MMSPETISIAYFITKMKGFLIFGVFAAFAVSSRVLLKHKPEDGYKILIKNLLKLTFIAFPLGMIAAGIVFNMYHDIWFAAAASTLTGIISSNIILWWSDDGWNIIVKRFLKK